MATSQIEGIILHSLSFKDYDQILTVFSPDNGIVKGILKGGQSAKRKKGGASSPLIRAEFVYQHGKNGLGVFKEISPISHHLGIRNNFPNLKAACEVIAIIQKTQLSGKPAPQLYLLLCKFLTFLCETNKPSSLPPSFCLKVLLHDGHIGDLTRCNSCDQPLEELYLFYGEGLCKDHAPPYALFFDTTANKMLLTLLFSRSLHEISDQTVSDSLKKQIEQIFDLILKN